LKKHKECDVALEPAKTLSLARNLCEVFPELAGKQAEVNKAIRKHIHSKTRPIGREILRLSQEVRKGKPDAALQFLKLITERSKEEIHLWKDGD
jgi:hypothetical protein